MPDFQSNPAALLIACDCIVMMWLMILTEPPRSEDPDRNTTAWN